MSATIEIHSTLARRAGRDEHCWKGTADRLGLAEPRELSNPPMPTLTEDGGMILNRQVDAFLENLFRATQRVGGDDINRLTEAEYNLPSMSVGDVVIIEGDGGVRIAYTVEDVGFVEAGRVGFVGEQ